MVPNKVHYRKDAEYQLAKAMKYRWDYPGDFESPLTFSQRLCNIDISFWKTSCFDISLSECVLIENGVINYHNLLRPAAPPFQFRFLLAICLLRKDPLCFLYYAAIIISLHFVRAENRITVVCSTP